MSNYSLSKDYAVKKDNDDELAVYRSQFLFPHHESGNVIYLNGNSLGLQPVKARVYLDKEMEDWKKYAVEGHFKSSTPWTEYQNIIQDPMARIVGAKPEEVVIMNTLTVNLHLMMVTFYNPTEQRNKILMEYSAFPSDQYAVKSQLRYHGYDPEETLIELSPKDGSNIVEIDDIKKVLETHGEEIALILIGGINYYTGQVYDMEQITELGHDKGCIVGFDLAHAVGNVILNLHEWEVDFAVWCTYKYLNSGPGSLGGVFIHEKFVENKHLNRFAGWWGHNKQTRFLMEPKFDPIPTAQGWQISNQPIFSLVPIRAGIELFDEVGMEKLRDKSIDLINYTEYLLDHKLGDKISIITPSDENQRGCQLSLVIKENGKSVHTNLQNNGVFCDWREPDVIRISLTPLYNSFQDSFNFVELLKEVLK